MRTLLVAVLVGAAGCGPSSVKLTWSFEAGDCASNGVSAVRVEGVGEFECSVGEALVPAGSTDLALVGVDSNGVERFRGRSVGSSLVVTLRPELADVTVKWTFEGPRTCADDIVIPYFIALYEWPGSTTTPPTVLLAELQESCATGSVVFRDLAPGKYLLDVASRVPWPDLQGREPLTVTTAEDLTIDFDFP